MSLSKLRAALRSDNRHRRAEAAIELGRRADRESAKLLRDLLDDPDDLVAVSAMFGYWLLGFQDAPLERAAAALSSADEEIVQTAVHALCEMGEETVPRLAALIQTQPQNAHQIVRILGDIGGKESRDAVKQTASSAGGDLAQTAREVLDDWED